MSVQWWCCVSLQKFCSQTDPTWGGHRVRRLLVQMDLTAGQHTHTHTHRPSKHCLIFTCSHFNAAWIKQRLDEIEHLKIWTSCLERLFMGRSGCINDISNQLNKKEAGFWHKGTSFQARFVQRGQHLFVLELTYIACFLYRLISNQIINKPFSIGSIQQWQFRFSTHAYSSFTQG